MRAHLRFLWSLVRHKAFVFYAGLELGVPIWRLLVHDFTKFTPAEWGPYVRRFGGGRGGSLDKEADPEEFHRAWSHHWHHNTHHWECWLRLKGSELVPLRMSEVSIREMVADWMGAGRAYTGSWDVREWYASNSDRLVLHTQTRERVEQILAGVA